MNDDFSSFERLKQAGSDAERACQAAANEGKDFFFQIRMLRAVYGLELGQARDVAAQSNRKN
ncbi:MAG: hypothetical protein ACKVPX_11515 [Myxococcaceae bacterium]